MKPLLPTFVDFFAGSGLVTQGVKHACAPVWANDICPRKAAIYTANHGAGHFHLGSIEDVRGAEISQAEGSARSASGYPRKSQTSTLQN